jgi:hypothetical protein
MYSFMETRLGDNMAKFAPVAPIQILEGMKDAGCLGDYHLLLAHHVLEEPDRFIDLFQDETMNTIFMDNSIVELGDAASDDKVLEACQIIAAARPKTFGGTQERHWIYPVLTDVMGDGPATIEASTASYAWWRENAPEFLPMVVLQGNDWETFTRTVDYFLSGPEFKDLAYVGIPRVLVEHLGTRQLAIQYVDAIAPDINVHLLGFSDDVVDDIICSNMAAVQGIDSAVPVRYSYSGGTGLYTPTSDIPARPADWFDKGEYTKDIWDNLAAIRRWVA